MSSWVTDIEILLKLTNKSERSNLFYFLFFLFSYVFYFSTNVYVVFSMFISYDFHSNLCGRMYLSNHLCSDKRLGIQAQTVSCDFKKVRKSINLWIRRTNLLFSTTIPFCLFIQHSFLNLMCLSTFCLASFLPIHLTIYPWHIFIYLHHHIHLYVCDCVCLPACLPACLCVCLFVCLFVCLSICLLLYLPACLYVCPCVCLSVCLSVCLTILQFLQWVRTSTHKKKIHHV